MEKIEKKSNYIIRVVKSVDKSMDYAISIVPWYASTDREQIAIEEFIKANWNN